MRNSLRLLIGAALALAGCAPRVQLPQGIEAPDRDLVLHDHSLRLHFANPHAARARPLVVFATGDGGWHRKDLDAWRHLESWGYPLVGFDARDYVTHLGGDADSTTPDGLADDYARIIDTARAALGMAAERPIVLVGVSRGAGLSVVAAGDAQLRPEISGVLAVALTREEEYVKWYRHVPARDRRADAAEMVQLYEYLPQLGNIPVAVVQSTRDNYLPAGEARALFGPDTLNRRFQSVEATDHSFAGARGDLYHAMSKSLDWIDGLLPRP